MDLVHANRTLIPTPAQLAELDHTDEFDDGHSGEAVTWVESADPEPVLSPPSGSRQTVLPRVERV